MTASSDLGRREEFDNPVELRAGFRDFIAAASRLEESHERLKGRAERIDRELAATNTRLADALNERESLLSALPVGVAKAVPTGASWRLECANREAHRLIGDPSPEEIETLRVGGPPLRDVLLRGCPVRIQEAELPGSSGDRMLVLEDRSQVQQLEREVFRLDRLAGLTELALGIAHEIKNPLHGAMGFAELLTRSTSGSDRASRYAERVRDGLARVDSIVAALLAFARPDGSREGHECEAVLLEAVVGAAAGLASVSRDRIAVEGVDSVSIDGGPVVQVFSNLFRNAAEARPDVGITVRVRRDGDMAVVEVEDDGPGVPRDVASGIFEPFVSTKADGHGLGLPLAARVLSYLGGSITLANPGEPGARFELWLPLREVSR